MTAPIIRVHILSEPHTVDLSDSILNSPAPVDGSFMIDQRLPRTVWSAMHAAGAWHLDAEELEDMDMFHVSPGWRYTIAALAVLLQHGYALDLRDETVVTVEHLHTMFTDDAKTAYHARKAAEKAAVEQAERARNALEQTERARKGAAYDVWQAEHLAGLVPTTVAPPDGGFPHAENQDVPWITAARFDKATPGAWGDTGDTWYTKAFDGVLVHQCRYGNAVTFYAPQPIVDAWVQAKDNGSIKYARHVLAYHDDHVYGSDVAKRLVELRGLDHYLARARSEEWIVTVRPHYSSDADDVTLAERYQLPHVIAHAITIPHQTMEAIRPQLALPATARPFSRISNLYRLPDGRIVAQSTYDTWFLAAEEHAVVDLALAPKPKIEMPDFNDPVYRARLGFASFDKDYLIWAGEQLGIPLKKSWSKEKMIDALVADVDWCTRAMKYSLFLDAITRESRITKG